MADKIEDTRQLITKNLKVLRILQILQTENRKISINEFATKANMPWSSLNNALKALIGQNIIDKDYNINPSSAYFMGISMSKNKLDISIVGLDGKCLDLEHISKKLVISPKFLDNYHFKYSLHGFLELSRYIKEYIKDLKSVYPIKAICFSFDDANIGDKSFSTSNYFTDEVINPYSFYSFARICDYEFKDLNNDVKVFLDCNSACYVLSKEYSCFKKEGNQLYLHFAKTGFFVTPIINNKIHYGQNFQALNVTSLINKKERQCLLSKDTTCEMDKIIPILQKILTPFIITLAPNCFSLDIDTSLDNSKYWDYFFGQIYDLYSYFFKDCYYPDYQIDISPNISNGTAISAMYQYYGWDLKLI